MSIRIVLAVLGLLVPTAASAAPQTRAEGLARIERLAILNGATEVCGKLGFGVREIDEAALRVAIFDELARAGIPAWEARTLYNQANQRQAALTRTELKAASATLDGEPPFRPTFEALFLRYDGLCAEAAGDPIFSTFVVASPPAVRAETRRDLIDGILELVGEASWQTPVIVERGYLMPFVGACQGVLPAAELEVSKAKALATVQGKDRASLRVRAFYEQWLRDGVERIERYGFDKAQCRRVIAKTTKSGEL